jgi:hypothetical protein
MYLLRIYLTMVLRFEVNEYKITIETCFNIFKCANPTFNYILSFLDRVSALFIITPHDHDESIISIYSAIIILQRIHNLCLIE